MALFKILDYEGQDKGMRLRLWVMNLARLFDCLVFFITLGIVEADLAFNIIFSDWWMPDDRGTGLYG